MAHQIHIDNGKASMMYVDEEPWHGLGTKLNSPATSAQAIRAANLDWEVVKKPLIAYDGKVSHPVPDRFAVIRKDWLGQPRPVFGVVGADYTPLQNRDAFEFFDSIVGEGAAIYHDNSTCDDLHFPTLRRELDGVAQEVPHHLLQAVGVARHRPGDGVNDLLQFHPLRVGCGSHGLDGGVDHCWHVYPLNVEPHLPRDDPAHVHRSSISLA